MQVLEYDRSFLSARILFDQFNGNLIISGAFGLFRKDVVIAAGGYDVGTVGEDMEIVTRLHVFCRVNGIDYKIRYAPDAICWTQAPETLGDLVRSAAAGTAACWSAWSSTRASAATRALAWWGRSRTATS